MNHSCRCPSRVDTCVAASTACPILNSWWSLRTGEHEAALGTSAGDPLEVTWARGAQGPHQIQYSLRYNLLNYAQMSWNGQFRSGNAYTPMIASSLPLRMSQSL